MELIHWGYTTQDENWQVKEDYPPGYVRIYQLESGTVYYQDSSRKITLQKDIIYLLPSHTTFQLTKKPGSLFRCLWLHVNLHPLMLRELTAIDPPAVAGSRELFSYMKLIVTQEKTPAYILRHCLEIFLHQCKTSGFLKPLHPFSGKIADLMDQDPGISLTVPALAHAAGYTPEHYIRLFKQECGITPYQFMINCRMAKACTFLREGYSITEISELTGYHDIKTFERAFKKCYGRTASDYQKNYKSYI